MILVKHSMFAIRTAIRVIRDSHIPKTLHEIKRNYGTEAVFLSGLPTAIRKEDLLKFYRGKSTGLKDARLYRDPKTQRMNGTAVLIYYRESQALDAIERLNHQNIAPRFSVEMSSKPKIFNTQQKAPRIEPKQEPAQNFNESLYARVPKRVKPKSKLPQIPENKTLYITNLPQSITIMKLKRIFGFYGTILNVDLKVKLDESTAMVEFMDPEKADEAKTQLSKILDGQGKRLFNGRIPKIQFEIQKQFNKATENNTRLRDRFLNVNFSPVFRDDFRLKTQEEEQSDSETQENRYIKNFRPLGNFQNINVPSIKVKKVLPGISSGPLERPNDSLRPKMTRVSPPNTYNTYKGQLDDMYRNRKYKIRENFD